MRRAAPATRSELRSPGVWPFDVARASGPAASAFEPTFDRRAQVPPGQLSESVTGPPKRSTNPENGLTLVELIVAFTIMLILTSMAVPLTRAKVRRERERDLRYALREIHNAIDKYNDYATSGLIPPGKLGSDNYPESLEQLVDGVKLNGQVDKKQRFLRRIPKDPFTHSTDWGLRSTQDDPKSMSWGGQNVFSVYTKSLEKAPDGTNYSDW